MVKRAESSQEAHCVNPSVFQEYIAAARLVNWQTYCPLFSAWLLSLEFIDGTDGRKISVCCTHSCSVFFFFNNRENDLEEVLTYYTQKNKSATVFLGTKKDVHEVNTLRNCKNSKSEFLLLLFFSPYFLLVTFWFVFNTLSFEHTKQE